MLIAEWIILLFVLGAVLLAAELFVPSHGLLGVLGVVAILAGVAVSFRLSPWLGVGLLAAFTAATPLAIAVAVKLWPRTPVGRRLMLAPPPREAPPLPVQIGQTGRTLSELRPMGMCDFDGRRVEVLSAYGLVEPGTRVKVVGLANRQPIVEVVAETTDGAANSAVI